MKVFIMFFLVILMGCTNSDQSSKLEIEDQPTQPLRDFESTLFSPNKETDDENTGWFTIDTIDNSAFAMFDESHKAKVYYLFKIDGNNSLNMKSYVVDGSVNLFDSDPWYNHPQILPTGKKLQNEKDYGRNVTFTQLPNTPFFTIVDNKESQYSYFKATTYNYHHLTDNIREASGSAVLVEEKFLNVYSELFFLADNGDIRSIKIPRLIEYFEYGMPKFNYNSVDDYIGEAQIFTKEMFQNESIDSYLNRKFSTDVSSLYIDFNKFRSYMYNHLDEIEALRKLSIEDYNWFIFKDKNALEYFDQRDANAIFNFEFLSEEKDFNSISEKLYDFIQLYD